ncbi:MAG: isoprenoid biosynthesis protein ElbB [Bacteroidetes bacterium GWA2_30_7]|nr:MAG: isoprenoid biosynthesis protein ElbB [Bacteroidetes bacterium GWA2_30_7]
MNTKKKFAVVLSGCGVYDGAEIHEATLTMYAIVKQAAIYEIFAPDIEQYHVINHITGSVMNEKRNVLVESARIARGKIHNLKEFKAENFDALIFPGGFGAAKNLSTFAFDGENCAVNKDVATAIIKMHELRKPIGALCISPVILSKVLKNVEVTIGQDAGTTKKIENMGAVHKKTSQGEVCIDIKNNLFTTPCYMLDSDISQIGDGALNIVNAILKTLNN